MVRGLPVEDCLDGVSNYGSWKPRVLDELPRKDERQALVSILFKHFVEVYWYILGGSSLAKEKRVSLHLALGFLHKKVR